VESQKGNVNQLCCQSTLQQFDTYLQDRRAARPDSLRNRHAISGFLPQLILEERAVFGTVRALTGLGMANGKQATEVELIVQPEDGVTPLINAIDAATKSIEIAIFRFNRKDLQHALERAVGRGVSVHALIANTNHGGEKDLRKLESGLLQAGIAVARTGSDFLRYHYKFMIVDRQILYMLTFNYTNADIGVARSFGIVTRNPGLVQEAIRLFEADLKRQSYKPELEHFVVSPVNARRQLSGFIAGAKEQLLIYDPEISDRRMIHLLRERAKAGVEIRIIGRVAKNATVGANGLLRMRFHTRAIIRDRDQAFVGSQSLREAELDMRRELGLIIHNAGTAHSLVKIFESDWATLKPRSEEDVQKKAPGKRARKRARAIVRDLPLRPLVERALRQALNGIPRPDPAGRRCEDSIEEAVREALEDSVSHLVRESAKAEARR
jgi:cardiolipin synthase A/B